MLTQYIQAAMQQAKYEIFPDDGTFYGEIPICEGVYANAATLEACRAELQEVLEDWILLSLTMNLPLPTIDGIDLTILLFKKPSATISASPYVGWVEERNPTPPTRYLINKVSGSPSTKDKRIPTQGQMTNDKC